MADGSLDSLMQPSSIAVVSASRHPGTIGYELLDNLLRHGRCAAVDGRILLREET